MDGKTSFCIFVATMLILIVFPTDAFKIGTATNNDYVNAISDENIILDDNTFAKIYLHAVSITMLAIGGFYYLVMFVRKFVHAMRGTSCTWYPLKMTKDHVEIHLTSKLSYKL